MKQTKKLAAVLFLCLISGGLYVLLLGSGEPKALSKAPVKSRPKAKVAQKALLIDPGDTVSSLDSKSGMNPNGKVSVAEIVKAHDFEKERRDWEAKKNRKKKGQLRKGWSKKNKAKKGFSKQKLSAEDRKRWGKLARAKNFYLEPKSLQLKARVIDGKNKPIPGARVVLRRSGKLPEHNQDLETRTNEEGKFLLSGTRYQFHINIKGPPGFLGHSLLVPWTDGSHIDLGDIVLKGITQLTGFVEGPAGTVVSGVTLKLFNTEQYAIYAQTENVAYSRQRATPIAITQSNESGRFTLNAPSGDAIVIAEKAGFRSSSPFELTAQTDRSRNQTLRLRRGQNLTVIVKDEENNVVEGMAARLLRFGELFNPAWNQPILASGKSDAEGRVVFDNVTFRRYQVAVLVDDAPPQCQNFQVNLESPTEIVIVLKRAVKVKGQLTSNDRETALSRATLLLYREGIDGLRDSRQINAKVAVGGDGRFELGQFHEGRYVLFIQAGGLFFPSTKHFEVVSGQTTLDLGKIELRALTTVKVQVRDAQGKGVAGCRFSLSTSNSDESRFAHDSEARSTTNSEGLATVIDMPTGSVTVAVLSASQQILCYQRMDVSTEVAQTLTINISGEVGTLHGSVTAGAGEAFQGGQLELMPEGIRSAGILIGISGNGVFRKEKIPTGRYSVAFRPRGQVISILLGSVTISKDQDLEKDFNLSSGNH